MKIKIYFFAFLICILAANGLRAQYNTARIAILSGGNLNFNFKTIADYKAGVEANNTIIGIAMTDLATGTTVDGFELYFSTQAADISGDGGINTLPLTAIQAQASNVAGFAAATFDAFSDLTTSAMGAPAGNRLMLYNDPGIPLPPGVFALNTTTHQVRVTFRCGMLAGNRLLGETADHYAVTIELWLWPQCNGADCP